MDSTFVARAIYSHCGLLPHSLLPLLHFSSDAVAGGPDRGACRPAAGPGSCPGPSSLCHGGRNCRCCRDGGRGGRRGQEWPKQAGPSEGRGPGAGAGAQAQPGRACACARCRAAAAVATAAPGLADLLAQHHHQQLTRMVGKGSGKRRRTAGNGSGKWRAGDRRRRRGGGWAGTAGTGKRRVG
ncbi:hypothetical protein PVAP13_8KG290900 [Panicum virgatum]|uniref:Uncharacterized protein n=1 Tax=Panicum virgatum TaxID=38727 RepID=A0A8T0PYT0_PANVG|nr:hypothetical protein PVAP13_8KG290900 [Panicum virgatum]